MTQIAIETEFYMLDIIEAVRKKREQDAQGSILSLQITNSAHMPKEDYKKFVDNLIRAAGIAQGAEKFDRSKMDQLHAFTQKIRQGG